MPRLCQGAAKAYLQGVRVDAQRGCHAAGRRDAILLDTRGVPRADRRLGVVLVFRREALRDVGHVAIQLGHVARQVAERGGLTRADKGL